MAPVNTVALTGAGWHSPGWLAALSEAWAAYCAGSLPIGACVLDEQGQVIARGRNRLGEPRGVAGVISGHDLAHAEINALLALKDTPRPDCYGWTVLTTVQPCPQCAGAIAMSGLRGVAYAAADPWAGCTHLLTHDPYVSRKRIRVERAPADVQLVALRLMLHALLDEGRVPGERDVLDSFEAAHPQDLLFTAALHESGTLTDLRERSAPLPEALAVLA
ncbi:nucleoside deaminase [Deinococcus radiotolerans]|uniref:CMP/dCMP-type deaminase domain-containing protein n=1 Tax=Deinococcus radiotolerans TaxID=1309407 RepID=A0ABQ2FKD8_9DEIO|nr:nucleoside deaminase [Deinococcus radiotolerans]GGL03087.1 hypothetical protein GCM10010844_22100 [Deinococcus radiotolerans]